MSSFTISGKLVDIFSQTIYLAKVQIDNGKIGLIESLENSEGAETDDYILPGFVDSHVHIESSLLVPSEFARLAVVHGTVATVSDPHEIANVCGLEGVEFMIANGKTVPFKFYFGAPSCVPATHFETAGATLDADAVTQLLNREEIKYLSEMMNFPGVLSGDEEVMRKIRAAYVAGKPIDGHAPGLGGENARNYIHVQIEETAKHADKTAPIISTDHECFTKGEALEKLRYEMKILIREGSAARNFDALVDLLATHPGEIMFCSDDKHPDSLILGHINQLCARAVARGIDVFAVLRAACVNPVLHYKLDVGLLRQGDPADFIVVKDLVSFEVLKTVIDGAIVAESGTSAIRGQTPTVINNFSCTKKEPGDFAIPAFLDDSTTQTQPSIPVIEALDGQLITRRREKPPMIENGLLVSDTTRDILKIVVVNRYRDAPIASAFITNFNLKQGALASSVAHDSHNIVAIGVDDESICKAVNMIIEHKGGLSCVRDNLELVVPLPIAGLMSNDDGYHVAQQYSLIDKAAKESGCTLGSPFMTLSFMALLVIPHLKLSDRGLFDGDAFNFYQWNGNLPVGE